MKSAWKFLSLVLFNGIAAATLLPLTAGAQQNEKIDTVVGVTDGTLRKPPAGREVKQLVYKVNPWVTIPISAVMTAGNFIAIPTILHAKKDLSAAELAALRPDILSPIDRWAVEQDPGNRDTWFKVSDIGLPATIGASLGSLFLDRSIRKDGWKVALMFYEAQAVTFTVYNFSPLGPSFQNRVRPIAYYPSFGDGRNVGGNRNSMFSGHTANAAAATFFAVKVYTDYHPNIGKRKYLYYGLAALPPLFVGYARVKALAHFPSDVLLGLVVGGVSGIGIPSLHKIRPKQVRYGVTFNDFGTPEFGVRWHPEKKSFKLRKTFANSLALH